MNWKELLLQIDRPIIGIDGDGKIFFSNKYSDDLFGYSLLGNDASSILTSFKTGSGSQLYLDVSGMPLKISKEINVDGMTFYTFSSPYDNNHLLNAAVIDVDLYAFFASSEGDFLMSTRKLRKLINVSDTDFLIRDGWDKLVDTLKNVELTGSSIKKMFLELDSFTTPVPSGPCEGDTIKWTVTRYFNDGCSFFLVTGIDVYHSKEELSDDSHNIFRCLDEKLVSSLIITKEGIVYTNPTTNINQLALGSGFASDIEAVFPDKEDQVWITDLLKRVSTNKGLMFEHKVKIKDRDFNVDDFAVQGYTITLDKAPAIVLFAIKITEYTRTIEELESDQRILSLYNLILSYLVHSTDVFTALILVSGDIANGLFAKNVFLAEIIDGNPEIVWTNSDQFEDEDLTDLRFDLLVKACESDEIKVTTSSGVFETDMIIPIILDYHDVYAIYLQFKTLKSDIALSVSDIKKVVEIGLREMKNRIELQHKTKRLEKLNQFRSDILEAVNHDLRTPLTSIIGFSELLQMDILAEEERKESIDSIKKSADLMNRLIDELTGYTSMLNSGIDDPKKTKIDLSKFLLDISNLMKPIFFNSLIEFRTEISQEKLNVMANKTNLEQIMINVLGNASKFTGKDGLVILKSEALNEKYIRVTVSDDGPGVSRGDQTKIFTKYGRASSKESGSGLGLYLSKNYIESIGGSIWLSSPGELGGATFYLTFPLLQN
ncbi:MAG: HAMP domain-containing sensor histidine kinase [Caldisericia bacterium]